MKATYLRYVLASVFAHAVLACGSPPEEEVAEDSEDLTAACRGDACETVVRPREAVQGLAATGGRLFWLAHREAIEGFELMSCSPTQNDCDRPKSLGRYPSEWPCELIEVGTRVVFSATAHSGPFVVRAFDVPSRKMSTVTEFASGAGWLLPDGERVLVDIGRNQLSYALGVQLFTCGFDGSPCATVGAPHEPAQLFAATPTHITFRVGEILLEYDRATWGKRNISQGPWHQSAAADAKGAFYVERHHAGESGKLSVTASEPGQSLGQGRESRWLNGAIARQGNWGASNGVSLTADALYLAAIGSNGSGAVHRVRRSTMGARTLATGQTPTAIATDGRWVYWVNGEPESQTIRRTAR